MTAATVSEPAATRPVAATLLSRLRGAQRRMMRWLRPPRRIFPTKAGVFVLGAPFVLGVAAINASNNLLFLLLGATLGAIVISGILSERCLRGVSADLRSLGDVHAAEATRLMVWVRRPLVRAQYPLFGIRVRERRSRRERKQSPGIDTTLPLIDGASSRGFATRTFPRRGRVRLSAFEVVTTYPFGLLAKAKDLSTECTVVVRPRRVEVPAALAEPGGSAIGGRSAASRGQGQDIYGLREWQERDPVHRIHALRSATLDRDVVVETEAMRKPTAWLGIANVAGANAEAFERTLEIAVATVARWEEAGYAVGVRTATAAWTPGAADPSEVLDGLSQLEIERVSASDDGQSLWLVPEGASPPDDADARVVRVARDGSARFAGSQEARRS